MSDPRIDAIRARLKDLRRNPHLGEALAKPLSDDVRYLLSRVDALEAAIRGLKPRCQRRQVLNACGKCAPCRARHALSHVQGEPGE